MEQKFFPYKTPDGQEHKIAYTKWGNGQDLLVCVHGLTRNGRDFDWLADAMCDKYTVICPSMPGRGKSDWLENAEHYSNEYNIEVTLALIASIPHKNLDWVGTSMGGIMGMILAATQPKLIRKMVLNDIGALISEEGMRRIKTYVKGEVKFDTREVAEIRFREIFAPFNIKEESDWQHYLEHGLREVKEPIPSPEGRAREGLKKFRPSNDGLVDVARNMRKNLTHAELMLWSKIKSKQLAGYKFRSQEPLGNFIVDFICYEKKVIIEVDGDTHDARQDYDESRTAYLNEQGFTVIRYTNSEVIENLDGVLEDILKNMENPPPAPPSGRGDDEVCRSYWSFNHDPKMGAAFPEPQEVDMWRLWNAINLPTLILRGGDSDILPKDVAEKMAQRENATFVEFQGFGHVPPLIDQEQINVVRDFLCS